MKRLKRFFFLLLLLPVLLALPAAAEEADTAQIYGEQLEASGADDLIDTLPEETRRFMEGLGITSLQPDDLTGLAPQNVLESLLGLLGEQAKTPLAALRGGAGDCAAVRADGRRQAAGEGAGGIGGVRGHLRAGRLHGGAHPCRRLPSGRSARRRKARRCSPPALCRCTPV